MEQEQKSREISVTWRGNKYVVIMDSSAIIEELGQELQRLTGVKADTMRLIVQSRKNSKLLSPFSDEHARLSLQETSIFEGKSIRMMGVPKDEVDQILKNAKADMRIAGFDDEEKRQRQRLSNGPHAPLKLPEGTYVFCEFRTLSLPGIELNPPASEAMRLMHKLAADPGIVAIMNKHRWRVGIMTEMAPEGKVGVSPVCILGLNKNMGEEISLRLRTDDLKGFRKYAVIKKTLVHELAHMVYSEHDAKFYALDSQLNKEAANLDWTRSKGHTLSGARQSQHYDEDYDIDTNSSLSHKLGGNSSLDLLANARASSVAAAYQRLANASHNLSSDSKVQKLPGSNDSEPDPDDQVIQVCTQNKVQPDPDDSMDVEPMESDSYEESNSSRVTSEPDPDDSVMKLPAAVTELNLSRESTHEEPDPDDREVSRKNRMEPDPDDSAVSNGFDANSRSDLDNSHIDGGAMQTEPDPDDSMLLDQGILRARNSEPDPDDQELQRIQDPVKVICSRLQKAIDMLQSEVNPSEAVTVLQTLFRIIKNVIEHPDEVKYRKLRKANPVIQRNIASYKAAMEFLNLIGFAEDVILEELGKTETYLVLKRNDPGLLWLAKSSLETCMAF